MPACSEFHITSALSGRYLAGALGIDPQAHSRGRIHGEGEYSFLEINSAVTVASPGPIVELRTAEMLGERVRTLLLGIRGRASI